jgi:Calpain family cysteine protease
MTTNITNDSSTTGGGTSSLTFPAWMYGLSTTSIRADMMAADVDGTVSYSGLEKLFDDLDATLSASKSSLTAAEFSDLKTIAADLNNGISTSSYLTSITTALVDGNAANATWTGGKASSTTLGDLAAGSSATQLSELVGKWFLGTDLPSSTIDIYGSPSVSISYSASADPVFGPSGPLMSDVNQGYLGDCYFVSALAEVAKQNPGIISSMFTDNGNNTYGVRFYVDGVATYVTVNDQLANGGYTNSGSNIWASLAEKAYAQLQAGGDITGNVVRGDGPFKWYNDGNSYSTIGNGGYAEYALVEVTGASAITDFTAFGGSWSTAVFNSSSMELPTSSSSGLSTASVLATLISDLSNGDDLLLGSNTDAKDSFGKTTLVSDHVMSIYGYDSATSMLEIRNPWGTMPGQTWDTKFEVSLSTLLSDGDTITADNVGDSFLRPSLPLIQAMAAFSSPGGTGAASPVHADTAATASPVLAAPTH